MCSLAGIAVNFTFGWTGGHEFTTTFSVLLAFVRPLSYAATTFPSALAAPFHVKSLVVVGDCIMPILLGPTAMGSPGIEPPYHGMVETQVKATTNKYTRSTVKQRYTKYCNRATVPISRANARFGSVWSISKHCRCVRTPDSSRNELNEGWTF